MNIVPFTTSQAAIDEASALLARCESGAVIGFTCIEEHPSGTYTVTGSKVSSRTQTAGMLLDAAITRLGQE